MKDLWRDFWTREPSETERDLIAKGFTQPQASNLIDLRLKFEYGKYPDDGGPAPRADSSESDKAA